ncbi:unnamed protein product [Ixodes pacificus]
MPWRGLFGQRGYISIHPTISSIVDDYPALKLTDQIFAVFFCIGTGVKAKERFMNVASENLPTVLMVTEGKPRPALFCEVIVRLHDAEDIKKKTWRWSLN